MRRADVVVLTLGGNVGKPRPALIVQADILNQDDRLATTIVLPLTSELLNMEIIRYKVEPNNTNGLQCTLQVMVDKIMQVEKSRVQKVVGHLTKKQMDEIESRLLAILGVH